MERIIMYCYTGPSWNDTPIGNRAIVDITGMTVGQVAEVADVQQEAQRRNIHIKRIQE